MSGTRRERGVGGAVTDQVVAAPALAVGAPQVVGPYVLATGAVRRTPFGAAVSVALQERVSGTVVVLTVRVRSAGAGLVVKATEFVGGT